MSTLTKFIRKRLARSFEKILKESAEYQQMRDKIKKVEKTLTRSQQVSLELKGSGGNPENLKHHQDLPWDKVRARLGQKPSGTTRSVVFVGQSYYHFYYLARALRARGWDAITVSSHDPNGRWKKYYHGQDVHLWSGNAKHLSDMRQAFFEHALGRFQMAHFAGDGCFAFFPVHYSSTPSPDFEEWLHHGKFLGFTISGCNTGVSKDSVAEWSQRGGYNVCKDRCPWYDRPEICSPELTLPFGARLKHYCSVIACETTPRLDYLDAPQSIFEPLTVCLDPQFWRPDLLVPQAFKFKNPADDVVIYHGMGESDLREKDGINIKGTSAIRHAIERLRKEGHAVRLEFATGIPNRDVRFLQVQADIIVDQLNIGRYGAQAREGMMLGKPVICYINPHEMSGEPMKLWEECPLVSATEDTVYEELKRLVVDRALRKTIGEASRAYALKWHSAEACAHRFEMIYDALMEGVTDFTNLTHSEDWRNADCDL